MGVPFDMICLDQIKKLPPYKVYVFFLTVGLDDRQRAMIHRVTRKEGMESVFLWAKGYVDGQGGGSADGISQLTGLRMRALEGPRGSAMIPDPDSGLALPPDHVPGIAPPGDERGQHRLCSNG